MKKIGSAIFIFCYFICSCQMSATAGTVWKMSDGELDSISAAGFYVNVEAVLALRQAMAVNQNNIAAVYGFSNIGTEIDNNNFASLVGSTGAVSIRQDNNGYVVASDGDIDGAVINNTNYAYVDALTSAAEIAQNNTAAFIALNGNIYNSEINNLNETAISQFVSSPNISQSNVAIVITSGAADVSVNNQNIIDNFISNNSFNPVPPQTHSFSYNDLTAIVAVQ